jgi:alanyl-tRNA synthetase
LAESLNSPVKDIEKKLEQSLEQSKKLEKQLKSIQQSRAADTAKDLVGQTETIGDVPCITANLGESDGNYTQAVADALMGQFEGVVVLGATGNGNVVLVANVSDSFTGKVQAGKLIQTIAPIVDGKGGGKPTQARGGGKNAGKLDEALAEVKTILAK